MKTRTRTLTTPPDKAPAGLSLRTALAQLRERDPDGYREHARLRTADLVAAHFARHYAGVPAAAVSRAEDVVLYTGVGPIPVLLGFYGDEPRVRDLLPGLPRRIDHAASKRLLAAALEPVTTEREAEQLPVDLSVLPVLRATPRDAGRYLTMGVVLADGTLSVHRMLVLDDSRLAIWMVPSRRLRARYLAAVQAGERLAVSVNIGAPPAAVVASALGGRFLPPEVSKLAVAGALAGAPLALTRAASQPVPVLAEAEIVIEGYLDGRVADEAPGGAPGTSMPEFLGYDGAAQRELPVITVTAITARPDPLYQAVIGPGREQSVILGLAGAVSVGLSTADPMVRDLHFPAAGGGMLTLVAAVRNRDADGDLRLRALARQIFSEHPFVKLIVFVDEDVDIRNAEDVFWAVTTRANLGADAVTLPGFRALPMDPSQSARWGRGDPTGRTYIDATVPYPLRGEVRRSFPAYP